MFALCSTECFTRSFPAQALEIEGSIAISHCSKGGAIMGLLELMAGAFIVSVPAFVLGDVLDRDDRSAD